MKPKVLVVDDELLSSSFLCLSLDDEGYSTRSASNAEEAINISSEFKPDILITDWMLKDGKDGIEIAHALVKDNPAIKIIFITGMASHVIIEKPVDLNQIIKILKGA